MLRCIPNRPPNLVAEQFPLLQIWELADLNKDGQLDFEEMCIALHLIYRCLDGEQVPSTVQSSLIPPHRRSTVGSRPHSEMSMASPGRRPSGAQGRPRPASAQSDTGSRFRLVENSQLMRLGTRSPTVPVGGVQVLPPASSAMRRLSGAADHEVSAAFGGSPNKVPPARPRPPSTGRLSGTTVRPAASNSMPLVDANAAVVDEQVRVAVPPAGHESRSAGQRRRRQVRADAERVEYASSRTNLVIGRLAQKWFAQSRAV